VSRDRIRGNRDAVRRLPIALWRGQTALLESPSAQEVMWESHRDEFAMRAVEFVAMFFSPDDPIELYLDEETDECEGEHTEMFSFDLMMADLTAVGEDGVTRLSPTGREVWSLVQDDERFEDTGDEQ
jgi:GMP synthase-like glutamine amidotransferase